MQSTVKNDGMCIVSGRLGCMLQLCAKVVLHLSVHVSSKLSECCFALLLASQTVWLSSCELAPTRARDRQLEVLHVFWCGYVVDMAVDSSAGGRRAACAAC